MVMDTDELRKPTRIWVWPRETPTGLIAWGSGCYRADPWRPLDDKKGRTGEEYIHADVVEAKDAELLASRAKLDAADKLVEAVKATRSIVSEAAGEGFNYQLGDWAERLFANQASLSASLRTWEAAQ